jgi:glycosyl hydrolase family 42 (putative beta-galactosidase)
VSRNHVFSRRRFLRAAFGTTALGAAFPSYDAHALAGELSAAGPESVVVARVAVDKSVYASSEVLNGEIYFSRPPAGLLQVRWIDGAGRVAEELLAPPHSTGVPQRFSLSLAHGLTYRNWIQASVDGVPQVEGAKFLLSPAAAPWDDFHTIMWADYPDGFYDLLESVAIDATIAYRDNDFSQVLDNNFKFYVEQLVWEIFSVYHKRQNVWKDLLQKLEADRENWKLLVRNPCLNDPSTDAYLRARITRMVRMHKAFRPLYYSIADELGQGDQIKPIDFCHSSFCTLKFSEYLRALYGSPDRVGAEWGGIEVARWDDETVKSGLEWDHGDLMIARTTTDRAFDSIAVAGLETRYGTIGRFNTAWGTSFPEPTGPGMTAREEWQPVIGLVREARSVSTLDEHNLAAKLGSLDEVNVRWGRYGGWKTRQEPTGFKSWAEVAGFLKRFYAELAEIRSTERWNVAAWVDFRNFMDSTFAAAVGRAAAMCKAEDPDARCATEGGQAPSAFGWYNYEQVVKSVDAIEPYNTACNVELVRSMNPKVHLLATHSYGYSPGKALTREDRVEQKRKTLEVWWQLFHGHRGAILWDNLEPNTRFVDTETRELTPAAEAFTEVFHEVRAGIARLVLNSRRTHDGIAIHYSHASLQIHWLLENLKNARNWLTHHVDDRGSRFNAVRNSWTKLLEDLGLQYDFASREQIEAGKLGSGEYRVFIMPRSVAVSAHESEQIREFVRRGGLLIADNGTATLNEHGRDLGRGQLDDVFGIGRAKGQAPGRAVVGVGDQDSLHLAGAELAFLEVGDPDVVLRGGKALAAGGNVPLVIVNRFGGGSAFFLNLEVAKYGTQRLRQDIHSSLPDLIEGVTALAGIRPRVRVLGQDGKRLPGAEVVMFANGACEHVTIFRNPQFDIEGLGDYPGIRIGGSDEGIDNSRFEQPAEVSVEWPAVRNTYDVRGREDLGAIRTRKATLDPWRPLIFTRSEQPIPKLNLAVAREDSPGRALRVTLTSEGAAPEGTLRVIRLEIETPAGKAYDLYSRNVLVRATPHTERVPLAYNDPEGRWRVRAHDLITGQPLEATFDLVP